MLQKKDINKGTITVVIAALIFFGLWYNARNDVDTILANLEKDVIEYQMELDKKCGDGQDTAFTTNSEECQKLINEMSDRFKRYEEHLKRANKDSDSSEE